VSPDAPNSERVTLAPGLEVIIRPIRPEDRHLMTAAFTRLSPESRYQRFFAPVERLSESDLTYLTELDHHDHEALVAIDPEDGSLVGVARYVCTSRLSNGDVDEGRGGTLKPAALRGGSLREAEVAVIVGDPWQGKGLATALLQRLARRASEEGIDYFLALVLEDNEEATGLFQNLVADSSEVSDGEPGTVEIRIELPAPESFSESLLARTLGSYARGSLKVSPWRRLQHRLAQDRQRRKAETD
jgi:GNAT superfamily N-acetyltransferase